MKELRKLPYRDLKEEKRYFPCGVNRNEVGFFEFKLKSGRKAYITAENHDGWEHVSIATAPTCPTWEEMCEVKDFFWEPEEVVIQIHPKKSEYVNICKTCLHLWRPTEQEIPCPPKKLLE